MSPRRPAGLDYDVAPDLVQPGAQEHQGGGESVRKPRRASLDYAPEPFDGARAPAGPSPAALRSLEERGLMETGNGQPEGPRAVKPRKKAGTGGQGGGGRAQREPSPRPSKHKRMQPDSNGGPRKQRQPSAATRAGAPATAPVRRTERAADGTPATKARSRSSSATRKTMASAERRKTSGNEARTARTIRLTARVEFKLQRIAEGYGVDLNAAVSIAVVHAHAAMVKEGLLDAADLGGRRP